MFTNICIKKKYYEHNCNDYTYLLFNSRHYIRYKYIKTNINLDDTGFMYWL